MTEKHEAKSPTQVHFHLLLHSLKWLSSKIRKRKLQGLHQTNILRRLHQTQIQSHNDIYNNNQTQIQYHDHIYNNNQPKIQYHDDIHKYNQTQI